MKPNLVHHTSKWVISVSHQRLSDKMISFSFILFQLLVRLNEIFLFILASIINTANSYVMKPNQSIKI